MRKFGAPRDAVCYATVDGIDVIIQEPIPFSPDWYSHKSNGPALRYEVCIAIHTGFICWVNGPYPAGSWPDKRIARHRLIYKVGPNEMILADGGYSDDNEFFRTPTGLNGEYDSIMSTARARHEAINGLIKNWKAIKNVYRGKRSFHQFIFRAVANLTQHYLLYEEGTFNFDYREPL